MVLTKYLSPLTAWVIAFGLITISPDLATGSPFTPLDWQQEVTPQVADKYHLPQSSIGQRKLLTSDRDQDHDFIDDEIKARFRPDQLVNVIVDLNKFIPPSQVQQSLSKFGKIAHIGKLVSFVVLNDVPVRILPRLAAFPIVAMIEWHAPIYPLNSIGTRAIEARKSITYSGPTAEDRGLTGVGVNIAIVDTGVDNRHKAFRKAGHFNDTGPCVPSNTRFVTGFDATVTTNQIMTACTSRDSLGHGTHVAGTALGLPTPTPPAVCLPPRPPDNVLPTDCGGVAPGAGLVDIKVCNGAPSNPCPFLEAGLDWIADNSNYLTHKIRVVNISLGPKCGNDNGGGARAVQVNALVSLGIAVVIAHGNAYPEPPPPNNTDPPYCNAGQRLTSAPGSAGDAMTVAGTQNQSVVNYTITRTDDISYNGGLSGPRNDFPSNPPRESLKPDFSAPAMNIVSAKVDTLDEYDAGSGTSMAAPFVAGAAALIIQARPNIDPFDVKDLLRRKADSSRNGAAYAPATDPVWEPRLGSGMITVGQALSELTQDIGFPSCVGPPDIPGVPCQLAEMALNNESDITIENVPVEGVPNTITAQVRNSGALLATVFVRFNMYNRLLGKNPFYHIGTVRVDVPAMQTIAVSQTWTPMLSNIQSIRVSIVYGMDSDFDNNVTQLSRMILPLVFEAREGSSYTPFEIEVENPLMVHARFEIRAKSNREGWNCRVSEETFELDPFEDPPRMLRVMFDAPPRARPGERAGCTITVYATPKGAEKSILIGEVSAQSLSP